MGSLFPICMIIFLTFPPSEPGGITTAITILPPIIAIIPPSTVVSTVVPVALRATRAIRDFIGGIVPMVTSYSDQLPTGTFAMSTASGMGGPAPGCWAKATVETPEAAAAMATDSASTAVRDMGPPKVDENDDVNDDVK